ncbi:MAG: NYN domain-containing protein [Planctomycetes bacterium]|nr:NYN domain-containing protein [Planctomycetota bacterium]
MEAERKMALFIDFDNIEIGIEEAKYGRFELDLILKRLVEKGKILYKRAYANWNRYTKYRRAFHEASIDLFDIPQKNQSGKNSADIQMVIDAMELCYSKEHIEVFVLASGDSDFSPLVSKLRENDKYVIGFGVKNSVSQLLVSNCDEFIYYEDVLVKPSKPMRKAKVNLSTKKEELFDLLMEAIAALNRENYDVIWGSMVKQTMKRKLPSFNEGYYGYNMFSEVLKDAAAKGFIEVEKDQRSGSLIVTNILT